MDALTATLALLRLEGLGPARYWQLFEHFGSASEALEGLPEPMLQKLSSRGRQQWREYSRCGEHSELLDWARAEQQRCAQAGVTLMHWGAGDEAPLLHQIACPPPLLYLRGNSAALQLPQIAVVGARRASRNGVDNAKAFAADLAAAGFAITSGLALGVDAAAHRGALGAGGVTVAVLGTGVDKNYPRRNAELAREIVACGGLLVSEFSLGSEAEVAHFPRRNRIISGLALGVLVVEAAARSGSLITARRALEQNREVFAIPGSIHNPLTRGCHQLIREGATLVETSADIVAQVGGLLSMAALSARAPVAPTEQPASEVQEKIVAALIGGLRNFEQLAQDVGIDAGQLMAELTQLELQGVLEQLPQGCQLTPAGARLTTVGD